MLKALPLRLTRRPWRFLLPGLLLFFFALTLSRSRPEPEAGHGPYYQKKTRSFFPPLRSSRGDPDYCENFPKHLLEDIQVVLKTGAGDTPKNKAHLSTVTSCIENLIIVSDHAEKVGDHQIIDILAELPPSYAINNTDFQAYAEHKKQHAEGETVNYSREGWRLDRFKFLPMVDKAYLTNPKAKWFVFLESDVYFFWDTLFRLLDQLDFNEPHYLGSPVAGSNDRYFAYGGAGFVISQGLMKRLIPPKTAADAAIDSRLSVRYEDWAKEDCCGDAVLGYAIHNATGVKLEALYPTFSGDELKKVVVDRDRWCVPLLSLHRISPEQMEDIWKWERTRPYNQKPFTYSTFLAYTHSHLRESDRREFWDNLSEAPVPNDRPAHRNADSCGSECRADPNCMQWSYSQTVCRFANHIKLGNAVDPQNGGQGEFISGWDTGKLAELGFKVEEDINTNDACMEATWLTPVVR
ncbi:hypothetical protein BS50DRAFT_574303 [Corynespora cassiicola Philippines]|uniref:N-acetylgalactosaminide beta-1,3-galactosyltransferase n=1 Tax=Corynespora cassiicola Philippines TaxID=1448308 RepID=A0A2T2NK18_CORCC|nr:hypothetical protein BS50DRAFT_574303 [Corynespora cassiicola Philippines]